MTFCLLPCQPFLWRQAVVVPEGPVEAAESGKACQRGHFLGRILSVQKELRRFFHLQATDQVSEGLAGAGLYDPAYLLGTVGKAFCHVG